MSEITVAVAPAPKTPLQEFWYYFCQNRGALIGLTFIAIVFVACVFAPWVAPFDPIEQNRSALLLPPAWLEGGIPLICWVLTILGVIFFPVLFMVQDCPSLSA